MKTKLLWSMLVIFGLVLLAGCSPLVRVGDLQTESQSVELGGADSVRAEVEMGAGILELSGGAQKLLEAGFTYNVARLKPEVEYSADTLVVQHPDTDGLPAFQGITGFRNEWNLRFNEDTPLALRVNLGIVNSDLQLTGLSLTGLDVSLGAGNSTIDLRHGWNHNLEAAIDTGAANLTLLLPKEMGVRVVVDAGVGRINAPGLTKDGNSYTNAAYGASDSTLQVNIQAGIGQINLQVEE